MRTAMKWTAMVILAVSMMGCATVIRTDGKSKVIHEEPVVGSDAAFEKK